MIILIFPGPGPFNEKTRQILLGTRNHIDSAKPATWAMPPYFCDYLAPKSYQSSYFA